MSEPLELEAGRELDALIAERVMGYVWRRARHAAVKGLVPPTGYDEIMSEDLRGDEARARDFARDVPPYSTDITAAWEVVKHMRTAYGYWCRMECAGDNDGGGYAEFIKTNGPVHSADGATTQLAICRAALKAKPSPTPEGTP